ncbi:hypothetical protein ACSNOI_13515 [Actinomadura kijaniata]|uniref:hypothetical protein n=1 Tax=Actinomadura kijaniata TaxID=46161 RepID=UPI003F1C7575
MSATACRRAGSVTTRKCQRCRLRPVGVCDDLERGGLVRRSYAVTLTDRERDQLTALLGKLLNVG